jgi:hypothetical protein
MLRWEKEVRSAGKSRDEYAAHSDFCAVFRQQLDCLYWLALILTGDELKAEECLLKALDSCVTGSLVFKESAVAWSRRSVIKCAICFMLPSSSVPSRPGSLSHRCDLSSDHDASLKSLQELNPFDRFVFVMSVLERYSDRECVLLLGCACADILPARIRALRKISTPRLSKSSASHASGAQPPEYF